MVSVPILESGMSFGPYPTGECFPIERCNNYQKIRTGVKIGEFLLIRSLEPSRIWVVEAKSSTPKPTSENFDRFVLNIKEKWTNTLNLYLATVLKRHGISAFQEMPKPFQTIDLEKTQFQMILVINGHDETWLPPLQDTLTLSLQSVSNIWNLPPTPVIMINEVMAQQQDLITGLVSPAESS